jgi:hypothetical protein
MDSISVSAPPGSPRGIAQGLRRIFTEPGPRLGRERLRNDVQQREPVSSGNPSGTRDYAESAMLPEPPDSDYGSEGCGFKSCRART